MKYLTAEQVLFVHARVIAETGGAWQVRDVGLLQSAVARCQATFEDKELYPDLFSKSAALFDALINDHPFIDGNKRTAVIAAALFLRLNHWELTAEHSEIEELAVEVAAAGIEMDDLVRWFKQNSKKASGR